MIKQIKISTALIIFRSMFCNCFQCFLNLIKNFHAMQFEQCFFMKIINIWSQLLKHNWWKFLYKRIYIYLNVFFDFTFNENSFLYDYINRVSFEFQFMHEYDQQLWFLFYRCESLFFSEQLKKNRIEIIINWFWKKSWFLRSSEKIIFFYLFIKCMQLI